MVGNFVLRWHASGAVKCNFQPYNWQFASPNDSFQYSYPNSDALMPISPLKLHCFAPTASDDRYVKPDINQWKATLCNDIGSPTVKHRIYCSKFLTLSNQMSCYIRSALEFLIVFLLISSRKAHYLARLTKNSTLKKKKKNSNLIFGICLIILKFIPARILSSVQPLWRHPFFSDILWPWGMLGAGRWFVTVESAGLTSTGLTILLRSQYSGNIKEPLHEIRDLSVAQLVTF